MVATMAPVQIRRGDFSPAEFALFKETTGHEMYPFVTALTNREIGEDQLMTTEYLPRLCAAVWLIMRRDNPELTFDEVYEGGIGDLVVNMHRLTEESVEPAEPKPARQTASQKRAATRKAKAS